jgi:hypothetical protein
MRGADPFQRDFLKAAACGRQSDEGPILRIALEAHQRPVAVGKVGKVAKCAGHDHS